jgi:hypothetical protein
MPCVRACVKIWWGKASGWVGSLLLLLLLTTKKGGSR